MTRNVILLPGMMLTADMWASQIAALRGAFECEVPGLSSTDTMDGLADDVLARAAERFHLVGFSMGAIIAMAMWRRQPHRIASLTLMGFSPHGDDPARRPVREAQMARAHAGELATMTRHDFAPKYFSPQTPQRDAQRHTDAIVEAAQALGPEAFSRQTRAQLGRADSVATLATVDVPALVMRGEDDRMVAAADFDLVCRGIPHARAACVPCAGHLITLEQPAVVGRLLQTFLTELDR